MAGLSLSEVFGEDAQEVKSVLLMFSSPGKRDAEIVRPGRLKTARELAMDGMNQAEEHAEEQIPGWGSMAMDALKLFIKDHSGPFMAEQVRSVAQLSGLPVPCHERAWGAVLTRAAKNGLIKAIGYGKTSNPNAHSTPATLWIAL